MHTKTIFLGLALIACAVAQPQGALLRGLIGNLFPDGPPSEETREKIRATVARELCGDGTPGDKIKTCTCSDGSTVVPRDLIPIPRPGETQSRREPPCDGKNGKKERPTSCVCESEAKFTVTPSLMIGVMAKIAELLENEQ